MCVKFEGDWKKTNKDLLVYKIVRRSKDGKQYLSRYLSKHRASQLWEGTKGKSIRYRVGVRISCIIDSSNFGYYCYRDPICDPPYNLHTIPPLTALICRIPKGSMIRYGTYCGSVNPTINTNCLIPIEEYPHVQDK